MRLCNKIASRNVHSAPNFIGYSIAIQLQLMRARKRGPHIHRAAVHRTIELLKWRRLVDELDLTHLESEKHCYEVKMTRDHIHLACFRCGRIEEFSSSLFEELKSEISKQTGFKIRITRLEVGGACRACAAEGAATEGAPPAPRSTQH